MWFYNTLDLLDTFENYDINEEDPRFLFVVHGRESALLQPYIEQITEEAFEALVERYGGYEPPSTHPNRGLSESRRLLGSDRRTRRHGLARRHGRKPSRHGLARRSAHWGVQLGVGPLA